MPKSLYLKALEELHKLTATYCRQLSFDDWENVIRFRQNLIMNTSLNKSKSLWLIGMIDATYLNFMDYMKQYPEGHNPLHNQQYSDIIGNLIRDFQ